MSLPPISSVCAFCGLPAPAPRRSRNTDAAATLAPAYCCTGCRMAAAIDAAPDGAAVSRGRLLRLGLAIFFTMNVIVFTMELWSADVYADRTFESQFARHLEGLFRWASLLFALPVPYLLAGPLAAAAWRGLLQGGASTDLLILLGVVASYAYSTVSVFRGAGHIYFEVGCVVLIFVAIGRALEARGKRRTGQSLEALARLLPDEVRAVDQETSAGPDRLLPRGQAVRGQTLRILPGERIPLDGRIVAGRALVDQQIVTGESTPIAAGVGDRLASGGVNLDGELLLEVLAPAGDDAVSKIVELVRQARLNKGRHEQLVERVSRWFLPTVVAVAALAAWSQGAAHGVDRGILAGLAVVIIACPCALGLATPMAVWTALGRAAQAQTLFRSGEALERLAAVDAVCFDKTGTLTTGQPRLEAIVVACDDQMAAVRGWARRLAQGSAHPLSQTIVTATAADSEEALVATQANLAGIVEVRSHAGRGVAAYDADGTLVAALGSSRWMSELGAAMPGELTEKLARRDLRHAPLACLLQAGQVRGVLLFGEELRPETERALVACRELGLAATIVTGDLRDRGAAIAAPLGVDLLAGQLPQDKAAAVARHGGRGTAMVGDGVNDAPALAAADVGVALGCGADLSRDAAGVCLLGNQLDRFPWAVRLARQTVRVVRQNLFWAFAYNALGIGLAATGRLNPIWAAAAMCLSSVLVAGNSLRLGRFPLPEGVDELPPVRDEPASSIAADGSDPNSLISQGSEERQGATRKQLPEKDPSGSLPTEGGDRRIRIRTC